MTIELEVVNASGRQAPGPEQFRTWLDPVLENRGPLSVSLRIVDSDEMQSLNARFRDKHEPTNVLAFEASLPDPVLQHLGVRPLGDVVICAAVVEAEARAQGKLAESHWAHLAVHGVLHLLGYDHQDDEQAAEMESLERDCLSRLGYSDPYSTAG